MGQHCLFVLVAGLIWQAELLVSILSSNIDDPNNVFLAKGVLVSFENANEIAIALRTPVLLIILGYLCGALLRSELTPLLNEVRGVGFRGHRNVQDRGVVLVLNDLQDIEIKLLGEQESLAVSKDLKVVEEPFDEDLVVMKRLPILQNLDERLARVKVLRKLGKF